MVNENTNGVDCVMIGGVSFSARKKDPSDEFEGPGPLGCISGLSPDVELQRNRTQVEADFDRYKAIPTLGDGAPMTPGDHLNLDRSPAFEGFLRRSSD